MMLKCCLRISVVLVVIVFGACKNTSAYEKYILTLDSLRMEVEKGIIVINTFDTIRMSGRINEYDSIINIISAGIKDTLSKTEGEIIARYKHMKKPLVYLCENNTLLRENMEQSKIQLQSLAEDIKTNALEKERAFEYITQEIAEANKLLKQLEENRDLSKEQLPLFDSLSVSVKKLISLHNPHNNW